MSSEKILSLMEVLTWLTATLLSFCFFNFYLRIRTAASLVLSFWMATLVVMGLMAGIFSETALTYTLAISTLYAIFKAIRDLRDDHQGILKDESVNDKEIAVP
jgi:hypothetical protein